MAAFRQGRITAIDDTTDDIIRGKARVDQGDEVEVAGFPRMLGPLEVGHRVVLNMTGLELELGTGGVAFILWNLDGPGSVDPGPGHIVKLRYTPWQTEVLAAEAPESEHHAALAAARTLDGTPVVACGLHSQLPAAAAGIKATRPDARIGYLMTDGGALPVAWSHTVAALRAAGLVDVTCTSGHAFGGDLESVNVFTGLLALRYAGEADVICVALGPGVVGTETPLGFSAIEQGQILDAATALGGRSIAALRISFSDLRERHIGISHHTVTALMVAARERCTVAVPELPPDRLERVLAQLHDSGVAARHDLMTVDGGPGLRLLGAKGLRPTSMGRSVDDVPELFVAAAAAGAAAASWLASE
ncbi:MAG: DUF3866 family protein [Actinomycetota bacterium]